MDPNNILNYTRQSGYICEIEYQDNNFLIFRLNIVDGKDADIYLDVFQKSTLTQWIRNGELNNPQRVAYHKYYVCQHSTVNKKASSSTTMFNTGCHAKLDILIKKCTPGSKRSDKFLKLKPPLCGKVKVDLVHNHNIGTSGSLNCLKISEETKIKFEDYFNNGMSPAEAIRYHERELMLNKKPWELLANSSLNPTKNVVYYLHKKWTLKNYGWVFQPIPKLKEKLSFYESLGMKVTLATDPWAVLVVTPIMERAQKLQSSSEIIFCDSTSSCDSTETTVTILLTITKAGAVLIAVLLHDGQSTESYEQAYQLLRSSFPHCFGGNMEPLCFMTDDSKAEKLALANTYNCAKQLLCVFHVLQREWRWLCEKKNNIPLNRRQTLIHLFRRVLYADCKDDLDTAVNNLKKSSADFPNFIEHFENFYARSHEWLYIHRKDLLIRGNNTNNYAEVSIRILKDIILHRTKGYNCVALVHFICFVWEEYFKIKLMDYAHARKNHVKNNYTKLCSKTDNIKPDEVCSLGDGLYQMPSGVTSCLQYVIDVSVGVCSCPAGINGAFCKHQAYLHKKNNIPFVNAPAVTLDERTSLGKLALGPQCPDVKWFSNLTEQEPMETESENSSKEVNVQENNTFMDQHNQAYNYFIQTSEEETDKRKAALAEISEEVQRLSAIASEIPANILQHFVKKLKKIQTAAQLYTAMNTASRSSIKTGAKIKVQPSSISRRRKGVTRGSAKIPSGRPLNGITKRTKSKRKHNISLNISLNMPNATLHGRAH